MKREEETVLKHLQLIFGENSVPVQIHLDPPDIIVNKDIGVEVRRLNQQFFTEMGAEGLENSDFQIHYAVKEILDSFTSFDGENSFLVGIEYQRPFIIKIVKRQIKDSLQNFLDEHVTIFPFEIYVNNEISLFITKCDKPHKKLFTLASIFDNDAGGAVINVYIDNIRHCISEKSIKISTRLENYKEWWLYLVDYMGFDLDKQELDAVISSIRSTGHFSKVVLLDYSGENTIATIDDR